jgi:hypothetical protein
MLLLVMGNIDIAVPFILNKIYRLTTGIVLAAMLAPVLLMTGRYTQVDWLDNPTPRHRLYDYRLWVDVFRLWSVPYVNTTIETRLADADGYANIGCKNGDAAYGHHYYYREYEFFHDKTPFCFLLTTLLKKYLYKNEKKLISYGIWHIQRY